MKLTTNWNGIDGRPPVPPGLPMPPVILTMECTEKEFLYLKKQIGASEWTQTGGDIWDAIKYFPEGSK